MTTRNYEAMFILENNAATADFEGTAGKVDDILQKHGATLVQKEKWDERKLAYDIKGQRRGTYYLVYLTADSSMIASMTEDLQLTEVVLRHMFIVLDLPIDEHISKRAVEREKLAEDSRRSSLGWSGGRRGGRGGGRGRDDDGGRDDDDDDSDSDSDDMDMADAKREAASRP